MTRRKLSEYNSNLEFIKSLEEEIFKRRNAVGRPKLTINDMIDILFETLDLYIIPTIEDQLPILILPDYDNHVYTDNQLLFVRYVLQLNRHSGSYQPIKKSEVLTLVESDLIDFMGLPTLQLPPTNIISCKGRAYDLITNDYLSEEEASNYYFPSTYNFEVLPIESVNVGPIIQSHNLWAQGDPVKLECLEKILLGSLIGLQTKLQIVIEGPGGNGKSTFLKECKILAGTNQSCNVNLHDLMNDPIFVQIKPYHKLVAGDDLEVDWRMGKGLMSRFKQFVEGEPVSTDRKFLQAIDIYQTGMKVQLTNGFPILGEKNQAVLSRFLLLKWSTVDFRNRKMLSNKYKELQQSYVEAYGSSLDEILENPESEPAYLFFSALISYLLNKYKSLPTKKDFWDFKKVLEPDLLGAVDGNKEFIDEFFDDLKQDGVFNQRIILLSLVYHKYLQQLKLENPGATPMKALTFYNKLEEYSFAIKSGHERVKDRKIRMRQIPFTDCNICEYLGGLQPNELPKNSPLAQILSVQSRYMINPNLPHYLDKEENVDILLNELASSNNLELSELLQLNYFEIKELYNNYQK